MGWADDYEPVEDRLRAFHEQHPYGRITTELIHHGEGDYIVKATIWRGDEIGTTPPAATGLAHDSVASLPANMKASALEVCETSAIGRALANLGFAPKGKRPSREEMHKASSPVPQSRTQGDSGVPDEHEAQRASTGATSAPDPEPATADSRGVSGAEATSEGGTGLSSVPPPSGTTSGEVSAVRQGEAGFGEGRVEPEGRAAPSPDALLDLLEAAGGSEVKAINAVNKACHTAYRKADLETLEPDEWAAGLAHLTLGGFPK